MSTAPPLADHFYGLDRAALLSEFRCQWDKDHRQEGVSLKGWLVWLRWRGGDIQPRPTENMGLEMRPPQQQTSYKQEPLPLSYRLLSLEPWLRPHSSPQ